MVLLSLSGFMRERGAFANRDERVCFWQHIYLGKFLRSHMKKSQPKVSNNLKYWKTFYSSEINKLYFTITRDDMASTVSVGWLVEGGRTDKAFMTTESCQNTEKNLNMR